MTAVLNREQLAARARAHLTRSMILANVSGAVVVFLFLSYLLPAPEGVLGHGPLHGINTAVFVVYMVSATSLGLVWGRRRTRSLMDWLRSGARAGDEERAALLRTPLRMSGINATFWVGAAVVFGLLNASISGRLAVQVASTIALGGVTTVALAYLLAERVLRPSVTLAHDGASTPPPLVLGVARRMVLAWGVGSGVPLLGIGLGFLPFEGRPPLGAAAVLFLVGVGLGVGFLATVAAARAIADPVQSVAAALRDVGAGRLEVTVPVYDASEIGRLQTGFNAMADGLRERERLQDLFGRHVGADVARLALERGVRLGGERREVAVLFVDVVGSTTLAVTHDPEEVVRRLNAFFGVVVDAVAGQGGWVNKFEGDAALCVFGAPVERADTGACALAAARALASGLAPLDLEAVIGVGAGPVVAGNIGTESRFEYTVIGDPVNVAARLAELARTEPSRLLADGAVVAAAGPEAVHWELGQSVVLRGRAEPTRLARPLAG